MPRFKTDEDSGSKMKLTSVAIFICVFAGSALAQSDMVERYEKAEIAQMRADIGKTFWINKPFNQGLELCPSSTGRFKECKRIFNISFSIKSVTLGQKTAGMYPMKIYQVQLADGRAGYMSSVFRDRFFSSEPTAVDREWISACEQNGPSIGMNDRQVFYCFGRPSTTNTTVTANGKREQLVYGSRGYIYLDNGIVSAVQTSQ
jgi:hypothetical protein